MNTGRGTLVSFETTHEGYVLRFRRDNGMEVKRIVEDSAAEEFANNYGVKRGNTVVMNNALGAYFSYTETSKGLVTKINVMAN